MVYYNDNELIIRNMEEADARVFTDEEIAQGWHTDISKYLARLQDQSAGKCVSLTAVYQGQLAGYVSVYITGLSGAFSGKGLPEIVDFGVLEKYRRRGIASAITSKLAIEILARNKVPFYCSAWSNIRSVRNGIKSGFIPAWVEMTVKPVDVVNELNL